MRLGTYLKTAFLQPWNLLAFLGGLGFALLSPAPDVLAALVLAAEVGYLGLLGTHPRFQKYVDAQLAAAGRGDRSQRNEDMLRTMLANLPQEGVRRFETLRGQCRELRDIARDLKRPARAAVELPLDSVQTAGLDRLLWIYLRLLFTEHSLARFFESARDEAIERELTRLQERIDETTARERTPQTERVLEALGDDMETCRIRLANYSKARDNHELVQLEINRLENKIRSLSELAVNRHEPEFISGQVDQVAGSMLDTERTMNELQFLTGLEQTDDAVPDLLHRGAVSVR
ncbi:MAG: hypothetical protein WD069_11600 [Planctomycetales bacterium]